MAKVKIQKKDIWIDMTPMSDVRYRKKTSGLT